MTLSENLFSNFLTFFILFTLAVIIYAKTSGKTLGDIIRDIRDLFPGGTEEVIDEVQGGFESIR